MKDKCAEIAEYYGIESQLNQLVEECAELIFATQKLKRATNGETFNAFLGELADTDIMIRQVKHFLSGEQSQKLKEITDYKLDRQLKRIQKEKELAYDKDRMS